MSTLRLVLRVVLTVLAAATLACAVMAVVLLYHYFGPPDDYVEPMWEGASWAPPIGFLAVAIAGGGLVRAHPAVQVVAGLGLAIAAALVVTFLAFLGSRPVWPGGEQGNLYVALHAFLWTALAVGGTVLAWRNGRARRRCSDPLRPRGAPRTDVHPGPPGAGPAAPGPYGSGDHGPAGRP